jgi:hypothetical protein
MPYYLVNYGDQFLNNVTQVRQAASMDSVVTYYQGIEGNVLFFIKKITFTDISSGSSNYFCIYSWGGSQNGILRGTFEQVRTYLVNTYGNKTFATIQTINPDGFSS